ncbi:hypothetical protein RIF29_06593 [Crotalaria pallida]|uniref:Cytochrome P450 n=1 Tax=Crotalaria pallida TaxID=3830 RepID=A0AAN9J3D0_CROPI
MLPETLAIPAILLGIFILILSASYLLYPKNSVKLLPPGPKALPIIALAAKYGPIMSLKLGQIPTIVVSSPEKAELFLKTHDTIFASRPKLKATETISYGGKGLVFSKYGAYWRNVRKLVTVELLSASKVEMFAPLRRAELGLLVKSLEKASASHEVVDVSELAMELIENVTYKMVLGRNKDDRFNLKGLIHEYSYLLGAFNLADYVPWLEVFDFQGLARRMNKVSKELDHVLEMIIKDHEQPSNNEEKGPDKKKVFVDTLLSLMHQPMDPHDEHQHIIDRTNIKAIIIDIIIGAYDTSAVTIEWAMSELLRHPRVMNKLQNELENVVGLNREVEETDLENLPYLNMVVKETLRLYPVGPLLVPRESIEDVTIDGYHIKKKSRILINAWAIGRNPKVWSNNANIFYPERFEVSDISNRGKDFRLIPFGSGRRGCPGIQMGLTSTTTILGQLVHCFNWDLPVGMSHDDLDMNEDFGLSIPRSQHLLARPTCRLLGRT